MFADPQTVTVNAVAQTLARQGTASPETLGRFVSADGTFDYTVRQNKTANRFRREIRLTQKKVAADPITTLNKEISTSVMIVVDEPRWGFSDIEIGYLTAALIAAFDSTAKGKLLAGES